MNAAGVVSSVLSACRSIFKPQRRNSAKWVCSHVSISEGSNSPRSPEWIKQPAPDLEEARTIHRITELLQAADENGKRPLTQLQRFLVTQTHNKTGQIIRKGELTPDERVWLIRSAQALLFTVF